MTKRKKKESKVSYPEELEGTIERIVYHNDENGYSVFTVSMGRNLFTVTGVLPEAETGFRISASGKWVEHPLYGFQYKMSSCTVSLPEDKDSMLKYLESGAVRGVGAKTAEKIVRRFGNETFDVIENNPEWLADIPGITRKKALEIGENFKKRSDMRELMMFCGDALPPSACIAVFKAWGRSAVRLIGENPYRVADEFDNIGFRTAERLAKYIKFDGNPAFRIRSGIKASFDLAAIRGGHSCLTLDLLMSVAVPLLGNSEDEIASQVDYLIETGEVVTENESGLYWKKSYWDDEQAVADKLTRISRTCPRMEPSDIEELIRVVEVESGIEYAGLQRRAIIEAVRNGVAVITGGPGTGKTTITKALIRIFESMGLRCALAAPTGRASKRMSEATVHEAKTIHRLLEVDSIDENDVSTFSRDASNPLEENVFIIDEASMLDITLAHSLLDAIPCGSRLILIGDSDQLPSVGAGNVLHDIIESGAFPVVRLTEIFRQAQKSLIIRNAHCINRGEFPDITKTDEDFFFLRRPNEKIAETIVQLCCERLPKTYGVTCEDGIQVVSPAKKGNAGTENLNMLLRDALNPGEDGKREIELAGKLFREGDKVIQTRNNYDIEWKSGLREGKGVYNGDIGVIVAIHKLEKCAKIRFDDRVTEYDFSSFEDLDFAYAVTVHKSQGSEYPIVVMPAFACPPMLRTRNLLYTAVTRAKKIAVIVGSEQILRDMVENDSIAVRYSGLAKKLRAEM